MSVGPARSTSPLEPEAATERINLARRILSPVAIAAGAFALFVIAAFGWLRHIALRAATDPAAVDRAFWISSILVTAAAAAFALVLLVMVRRLLVAPIRDLGEVAGRAARGELSRSAAANSGDEIGDLARSVNRMIGELREAREERTRLIVDAALDAVVTIDETGRIIDWNAHAEQIFGWPREEALGRDVAETIVPEPFREAHNDGLRHFIDTGESSVLNRRMEFSALRRSGAVFPIEIAITPLKIRERLHFNAFIRDITERRAAEEALRLSEERFRRLVETANVIPWQADPASGRFTYVGPQIVPMLGFDIDRWHDVDFWIHRLHPEDVDYARAALRPADGSHAAGAFEYRVVAEDGRIVWLRDIVTTANVASHGETMIGFRFDITERKKLEQQLLGSQRMEAVGRLAGGIAHDFNNLITAILGYASLVQGALPAGLDIEEDIAEISRAAERAAGLTQQLLAFARKQVIQPRTVRVDRLVLDLEKMMKRLIGEDVELTTRTQPDGWFVRIDPGQFEQVLVNLAVNARDAMPEGGTLDIETANVVLTADADDRADVVPGDYVLIAVADTGSGMNAATVARIFEPFFTTKEIGKGTGLGLATCYGIVKQAGGYIWVDSEFGRGTTFRIYIPRVQQGAEPEDLPEPEPALDRSGGTILLAEDEAQVRALADRALTSAGFTVLVGHDGQHAIEVAAAFDGTIDLFLTDMVMPRMSGKEAAQRIRRDRPGIRILLMSGYPDQSVEGEAEPDSTTAFLPKPFTPKQLIQRVREILEAAVVE